LTEEEIQEIEKRIFNTIGFATFYRAYFVESDLEKISALAVSLAEKEVEKRSGGEAAAPIQTFGIFAERLDKGFEFSSKEVGQKVGSAV
jgi:adenylyl- and sulfurtransferase ThiI